MFEYLVQTNPVLATIVILLGVAIVVFLVVKTMQKLGLDTIRLYAYNWFEKAEDEFEQGQNEEKFEYVLNLAKMTIPSPFNVFITESVLRKAVQLWFDLCKDLLDDGKINASSKVEEGEE